MRTNSDATMTNDATASDNVTSTTKTPAGEKATVTKTLLDCGNCGPDFNSIRQMVTSNFNASVVQSHGAEDTLEILRTRRIDLVTVNRKLDRDYTDGMEVIKAIKADPDVGDVAVMLVTNYDEHQDAAVAAGCVRGFGKLSIGEPATREMLEPFLGAPKKGSPSRGVPNQAD